MDIYCVQKYTTAGYVKVTEGTAEASADSYNRLKASNPSVSLAVGLCLRDCLTCISLKDLAAKLPKPTPPNR